eukprot:scaffold47387_cov46-Phaeocystis_antarctica.AAC.2
MILSSEFHVVTVSRARHVLDILPMQLKLIICHPPCSVTVAQGGGAGDGGGGDGGGGLGGVLGGGGHSPHSWWAV